MNLTCNLFFLGGGVDKKVGRVEYNVACDDNDEHLDPGDPLVLNPAANTQSVLLRLADPDSDV